MYYLGIDWATEKHDLCLLDESEAIVQKYGAANILFNIERSDGLLVNWMVGYTPPDA